VSGGLRASARLAYAALDVALALPLALAALLSRLASRPVDVGLGPLPLVNNVHHKRALEREGFSAETFVHHVYHVTDEFDVRLVPPRPLGYLARPLLFLRALVRYRALYHYFDGGALGDCVLLWRLEPLLYRLAGIRVVVLAYGSDVQDPTHCPNLAFRHALAQDYPAHHRKRARIARQIDHWTRFADHVVAGCDWVDYLPHWDTLQISHFSIDTERWAPGSDVAAPSHGARPLRVLHAPNHRAIKGTEALLRAVEELRKEGVEVELRLLERRPNHEIRRAMADCDVVADQFVIGWYAMFAIEGMALARPVLCHVRPDLERLYVEAGLLAPDELPLVRCAPGEIAAALRRLQESPELRRELGVRSREYVLRHHSLEAIGAAFARINRGLGILPSGADAAEAAPPPPSRPA